MVVLTGYLNKKMYCLGVFRGQIRGRNKETVLIGWPSWGSTVYICIFSFAKYTVETATYQIVCINIFLINLGLCFKLHIEDHSGMTCLKCKSSFILGFISGEGTGNDQMAVMLKGLYHA